MQKVWKITQWDGSDPTAVGEMPGNMTETEITTTLQRLVCRHLNAAEILSASRRKGDVGHSVLLERVGKGRPLSFGHDPNYTAEIKE